ncbi:hypothetical protein DAPPUDRAFT_105050 [Daphnia pulex]|uniref:Uncharacterized protein n=1 Tax=Daphnia pulex TaxID=6669 RepID=E9GP95_DAPPU|nr:hypothetical protein DAPPUDRAFT_105050 [Daphnia pulex]|eukprot:EFX78602.1 hypothetical protein DAPPUDRAFT_105050 [Daphnia pulex]
MEISAGHLVPAENFCQSSRTSRKLLPANSYQPEDYASHLVPAGTVLYRQMPPRTTISYWYEMEKISQQTPASTDVAETTSPDFQSSSSENVVIADEEKAYGSATSPGNAATLNTPKDFDKQVDGVTEQVISRILVPKEGPTYNLEIEETVVGIGSTHTKFAHPDSDKNSSTDGLSIQILPGESSSDNITGLIFEKDNTGIGYSDIAQTDFENNSSGDGASRKMLPTYTFDIQTETFVLGVSDVVDETWKKNSNALIVVAPYENGG